MDSVKHTISAPLSAFAFAGSLLMASSAIAQDRTPIAEFKNGFTTQQLAECKRSFRTVIDNQ